MWPTYEAYCKDMKRLGTEPLHEEIWRREYAPKDEAYREPLIVRPKKPTVKKSLTVEIPFSSQVKKTPPKKPKTLIHIKPRPSQRKHPKMTESERKEKKIERQRAHYRRKVGREVKQRSAQMDLSHLTPEEKRQHRLKKQKEYRERRKALGIKEVRTPAQKAQRNEYFKHYYEQKKNDPKFMQNRAKNTGRWRKKSAQVIL